MTSSSELISVIIPLYNKEATIEATILSVLNQDYTNFEVIVIDDGSSDTSYKVVECIKDERVSLFRKNNGGVSSARNYGLEKASGQFIFFLDADDYIKYNCLTVLMAAMQDFPDANVSTANFILESKNTVVISKCSNKPRGIIDNPHRSIFYNEIFPRTGNTIFRRSIFNQKVAFDDKLSLYEDMKFIFSLLEDNVVVYDPNVVFTYKLDYASLSKKTPQIESDWTFIATMKDMQLWEKLLFAKVVLSSIKASVDKREYSVIFRKLCANPLLVLVLPLVVVLNRIKVSN